MDAIFWNNCKDFLTLYVPISLITFAIGYGVFRCTFQKPVSFLFRLYSFVWHLSELIILANAEKLTFLVIRNMEVLFFLSSGFKLVQGIFVTFSFFIFINVFTIFFVYRKEYNKLYKYFLSNMFRVKGSF